MYFYIYIYIYIEMYTYIFLFSNNIEPSGFKSHLDSNLSSVRLRNPAERELRPRRTTD